GCGVSSATSPVAGSTRTTASSVSGPDAIPATPPSTTASPPGDHASSPPTGVTSAEASSSTASRPLASTAWCPPPSGANQREPGRHHGPPSSAATAARFAADPSSPIRYRFHQPAGSIETSSASGDSHSSWHTATSGPPERTRWGPNVPSSATGATQSSVPSHGNAG